MDGARPLHGLLALSCRIRATGERRPPTATAVLLMETANDAGLVAGASGADTVAHDGAAITVMSARLNVARF